MKKIEQHTLKQYFILKGNRCGHCETVLTPFGGIGSEAYQAVKYGRNAVLIEIKEEYFKEAIKNLRYVEKLGDQNLFNGVKNDN